jgi:hypothetical protein
MIRYSSRFRCPICNGCDSDERGAGKRCSGFLSDDPGWARCTRPEHAGELRLDERTSPPTYAHKLDGACRCGTEHGPQPLPIGNARRAATTPRRVVATYDYQTADGRVLYRVARMEPKGFQPQHVNGTGRWEPGYASAERVLYRLPELIAAHVIQTDGNVLSTGKCSGTKRGCGACNFSDGHGGVSDHPKPATHDRVKTGHLR